MVSILGTVAVVAGIIGTWFWNSRTRKDKILETRQSLQAEVESTARAKFKEEETLAEKLAVHNEKIAIDVKQGMKEHVDRIILTLKSDIELQRTLIYAKMEILEDHIAQIKIDLAEHILNKKEDLSRMQKSIDFLQTMAFGPEAKSIPPYIMGEEKTVEHDEEPDKGVFASRADTTDDDTKDPE